MKKHTNFVIKKRARDKKYIFAGRILNEKFGYSNMDKKKHKIIFSVIEEKLKEIGVLVNEMEKDDALDTFLLLYLKE